MRILLGILLFFSLNQSNAQKRYLTEITNAVKISTYTYIKKQGDNLKMDIYTPVCDNNNKRPVLLYVHGGGFYTGIRNDEGVVTFCKDIAKLGFVAVSIEYRLLRKGTKTLFGCDCPKRDKILALYAAVEDLQDAMRFLMEKDSELGIDKNAVILCGSSAGAETVLSAVYNPNLLECNSQSIKYAGVISMAGAIIDTSVITKDIVIPTMFFHGTSDNIVPYNTAPHHYCAEGSDGFLFLNGSKSITEKLQQLGEPYWLYSIVGGDHSTSWKPMKEQFNEIVKFCNDFVLKHSLLQISTRKLMDNEKK